MFSSLLIANRGEIACRIAKTAAALGIRTVAVYSEADASSAHVAAADEAVPIGPSPAAQSYLQIHAILDAARRTGAEAVHPGYGFLAESAAFASAVQAAGLTWIGPQPDLIEALGDKHAARKRMAAAGMPVTPGGAVADVDSAVALARRIGYPVMVKPSAGGGGIGMRIAEDDAALRAAVEAAGPQAERFFGDATLILERFLPRAHHVEIQILGLGDPGSPGYRVVALGDRDCSVQRRWQKVIEETPSPAVGEVLRKRMMTTAAAAAEDLGYTGAGTVECLVSGEDFVFCEVNARLQVEHPITELCTGIDLVAEQLRAAAAEPPGFDPDAVTASGHAIELRIYAEDPKRFLPSPGRITRLVEAEIPGIRIDSGYREGDEVSRFYDPLIAKLCAHGPDRPTALDRARSAVASFVVEGPKSNLAFLAEVLDDASFRRGEYDTGLVGQLRP